MKVVIFTGIGLFSIPKAVGDYLVSNKGWDLVDDLPEYDGDKMKKVFIVFDHPEPDSYYYSFNMFDKSFRCHDDIIDAYTQFAQLDRNDGWGGYKIIDIPDNTDWYIDEHDDGSESIHEKHRVWN